MCSSRLGGSFVGSRSSTIYFEAIRGLQLEATDIETFTKDVTSKAQVVFGKILRKPRKLVPKSPYQRPTLAGRKVSLESVGVVISNGCSCGADCGRHFSKNDLLELRQGFFPLSRKEQDRILLDKLKKYGVPGATREEGYKETFTFNFRITSSTGEAVPVCGTFWWKSVGISKTRYLNLRAKVLSNKTSEVSFKRAKPRSDRTLNTRNFLVHYATLHGQHVPNKPEIHLQRGVTKTDAWETYRSDTKRNFRGDVPISLASFCKLWQEEFAHLKCICLPSTDFARCDFCVLKLRKT